MKKKLFFLSFIAALALTGCSSNDDLSADGSDTANGESRYLAVSIVSTDNGGTRATGDPATGNQYEQGGFNYEDGLEKENKVNSLRVYFFTASGQPVYVKSNVKGNYYDVPTEDIKLSNYDGQQTETVEKRIEAVLIINKGEQTPAKIVAVLNHNSELGDGAYTLSNLRRQVADYASLANNSEQFVMSNSVYLDRDGNIVEAQDVTETNYKTSAEAAKKEPVTIYVERNVAKVRVSANIPNSETKDGALFMPVLKKGTNEQYTIKRTKENEDGSITTEEVSVYVKFYGWDVTGDLKYAYLSKAIRPGWKAHELGSGNWNDFEHHRSYWAGLCDGGTTISSNDNQWFSYVNTNNFKFTKFDGKEWKYCNENGEKQAQNSNKIFKSTDVIIKGELCDQNGKPLTFTEIAGTRILDDDKFTNLKDNYLTMLKSARSHSHWKVKKNADGKVTEAKEISADDITFITANEKESIGKTANSVVANGSYYVYAQLKPEVANSTEYTWYSDVTETEKEENGVKTQEITVDEKNKLNAADVNRHLIELSHAKIWNSGMTYYFAEIMQSATVPGVVRNHIYDMNLKNVYGIGTPVYKPEEVIIPEKPKNDDTYIAAEIRILSWRLVSNDVDLEWD